MISNPINNYNKQSFLFKPLKIVQSLGWVVVAILALPTVIGSYFAWKKLTAIWSKNEKPDTEKAHQVATLRLNIPNEEDFEDVSDEDPPTQTPQEEKKALYEQAINQFKGSGCLASRSAAAYFDYLKSTSSGFHFNMDLLHNTGLSSDVFLTRIKEEVEKARKEEAPLVFVPFLLAGNLVREQHIVVAVINTTKQQIEYFDPKGHQSYSTFGRGRNLAQWNMSTQEFLKKLSATAFPDRQEPSIIRNINGPQSSWNKVDCGAHALDFIQTRLYTDFIPDSDPNYFKTSLSLNGEKLRKELAATLEAHIERGTIRG